ncbi:integrase [Penaeus vannamei nudivirus]|nr:integrase [Penaeus vannamei nucleopolyhedrovirus]
MEFLDQVRFDKDIEALKYKPPTFDLPTYMTKIIHDNNLLDIEDEDERAKIFIQALYFRKLKSSTVSKYFKRLKPYLFKTTKIKPNALVFDNNYPKRLQVRGYNLESIKRLIKYVKDEVDDNDVYKWPILLSAYSGLRLNEVCNVTMANLKDLVDKKPVVGVKRKNNKDWIVVYYNQFDNLVKYITEDACKEKYKLYVDKFIDQKLFPFTNQALHYKLKYFYQHANDGNKPPTGFGLHTLRYYLASMLYENTKKIEIPQTLLGHKSFKTTYRYIRDNTNKRSEELNKLYTINDFYKRVENIINE